MGYELNSFLSQVKVCVEKIKEHRERKKNPGSRCQVNVCDWHVIPVETIDRWWIGNTLPT